LNSLRTSVFIIALVALGLSGCRKSLASQQDCNLILNRLTELSLVKLGYHDPALLQARQAEFIQLFAAELVDCEKMPLDAKASACIKDAKDVPSLVHICLK